MSSNIVEVPVSNEVVQFSKEDQIKFTQERIQSRSEELDKLFARARSLQAANARDMVRLQELRLLKDIRDGRVTLTHTETGEPITVHVFKAA